MNEIKTRKLNDLKLLLEKTEIEVEIKNKYIDEINDFMEKYNESVAEAINSIVACHIFKDANQNNFVTKAELDSATEFYGGNGEVRELTQNDYTYILDDETHGENLARYVYVDNKWVFQISLTNKKQKKERKNEIKKWNKITIKK